MEIRKGNKNPWINRFKYYLIILLNMALLLFNFAGLKLHLTYITQNKTNVKSQSVFIHIFSTLYSYWSDYMYVYFPANDVLGLFLHSIPISLIKYVYTFHPMMCLDCSSALFLLV